MTKGISQETRAMTATGLILTLVILCLSACALLAGDQTIQKTADELYTKGNELFQQRKFSDAIEEYQKVLDQFPDQAEACAKAKMSIGKAHYEMKDMEKAHYALREVTRDYRSSVPHITVWAQVYLADMYQKEMIYPAAIKAYEELVSEYPDQTDLCITALTNIGKTQKMRGKIAEALAAYQRIVDEFPVSSRVVSDAMFARADICRESGYHDAAMLELKKLMEMYERDRHVQVTAKLRMASCLAKTDPAAARALSKELANSEVVRESSDLLYDLLTFQRLNFAYQDYAETANRYVHVLSRSEDEQRAEFAHIEIAYYFAQDHGKALSLATAFLEKYPTHSMAAEAAFIKANCLLSSGDKEGALTAFDGVLAAREGKADTPSTYINGSLEQGARILVDYGRIDEAVKRLQLLVATTPETIASKCEIIGRVLMHAKQWAGAATEFRKAAEIKGISADTLYSALYNVGVCCDRMGDSPTARNHMQKIVRDGEGTVWAVRARGMLHLWSGG